MKTPSRKPVLRPEQGHGEFVALVMDGQSSWEPHIDGIRLSNRGYSNSDSVQAARKEMGAAAMQLVDPLCRWIKSSDTIVLTRRHIVRRVANFFGEAHHRDSSRSS